MPKKKKGTAAAAAAAAAKKGGGGGGGGGRKKKAPAASTNAASTGAAAAGSGGAVVVGGGGRAMTRAQKKKLLLEEQQQHQQQPNVNGGGEAEAAAAAAEEPQQQREPEEPVAAGRRSAANKAGKKEQAVSGSRRAKRKKAADDDDDDDGGGAAEQDEGDDGGEGDVGSGRQQQQQQQGSGRGGRGSGKKRRKKEEKEEEVEEEEEELNVVEAKVYTIEEGWARIRECAIDKLIGILDGGGIGKSPASAAAAGGESGQQEKKKKTCLFSPKEYIDVYTACYDMCTQNGNLCDELYGRYGQTIDRYLTKSVVPALRRKLAGVGASGGGGSSGADTALLAELQHRWSNHQIMIRWLKRFFAYLDRNHAPSHALPTLAESGMRSFRKHCYGKIRVEATAAALALIRVERDGNIVDKSLIRSTVNMYETMGSDPERRERKKNDLEAYEEDLEAALLEATRTYYAQKRDEWMSTTTTPDYLVKAERAYEQEKNRVAEYLHPSSGPKILEVLDEEILAKVETELLQKESSGCVAMLQNEKSEDLQRMCRLFSRLGDAGLKPIAEAVRDYLTSKCNDVTKARQARLNGGANGADKDRNDDPTFVKALMVLHGKSLKMVRNDFGGHALFQKALKDAFDPTVNRDIGKHTNAELIASFADRVLRSGGEKCVGGDSDVEDTLNRVVELFMYLAEKDVFAEIYRNQLAKRLLSQRSTSDTEKIMIAKLKVQCGTQFTSKMEGMLSDLAVSARQRQEYERHIREKNSGSTDSSSDKSNNSQLDFSCSVLNNGFWPTYKSPEVTLTERMTKSIACFTEWHNSCHQKRKLTWILTQGSATVRGTFGKKSYDFQVSTLQAIALDSFNGGKTHSFEDLSSRLNLEEAILKRVMHSLCCGKHKVIAKTPATNKINVTDTFVSNTKFMSNMRKIRIPMASLELSCNKKKVQENREVVIDAAIVRIMKARKTLAHQQLVAQVLAQLSLFNPNPRVVKRRIEVLIERDYLERNTDDSSIYNYLA